MTIEERIERLERTNRRYRLMFALLGVLAVCAVGISATQDDKVPDVIQAKAFEVVDEEGNRLVKLGQVGGAGSFGILDKTGVILVQSSVVTVNGKLTGNVATYRDREPQVMLASTASGHGAVITFNNQGKELVSIASTAEDLGGRLTVYNKTGESVCTLTVDEYGNGVVGAWDRNGKGRTLKPGP